MLKSNNWQQLEPELELHATTDDDELPTALNTKAVISSNVSTPKDKFKPTNMDTSEPAKISTIITHTLTNITNGNKPESKPEKKPENKLEKNLEKNPEKKPENKPEKKPENNPEKRDSTSPENTLYSRKRLVSASSVDNYSSRSVKIDSSCLVKVVNLTALQVFIENMTGIKPTLDAFKEKKYIQLEYDSAEKAKLVIDKISDKSLSVHSLTPTRCKFGRTQSFKKHVYFLNPVLKNLLTLKQVVDCFNDEIFKSKDPDEVIPFVCRPDVSIGKNSVLLKFDTKDVSKRAYDGGAAKLNSEYFNSAI